MGAANRDHAPPSLTPDFGHAVIEGAIIGPRREVTLVISPITWHGQSGDHEQHVLVRFGGIENFAEVAAFFAEPDHQAGFELAALRRATTEPSRPGKLRFDLIAERADARLVIRCRGVRVGSGPGDHKADSS